MKGCYSMKVDDEARAMSRLLDDFLNDLIDKDRLRPMDLFLFVMNMLTRLRAYFTVPDMMNTLYGGVMRNEEALQRGKAVKDPDTGEDVNMLLAEERTALQVEKIEAPDTVPEDWANVPRDVVEQDWDRPGPMPPEGERDSDDA